MIDSNLQISPQQAEQLASLGSCLRQCRFDRSMTLEDVADKTKIQVRLLRAIEEAQVTHLPEAVYVQGFIRRYAEALGLDGNQFANAFSADPIIREKSSWRDLPAAQLRPIHLYLLYLALIVGAVSGLSYMVNRPSAQLATAPGTWLPSNGATAGNEAGSAESATRVSQSSGAAAETTRSVDGKSVRVGVTLTGQSWLMVVADGKTAYEGILEQGTQRTWSADRQLVLRAGNAGAVMVVLNDGKAKQLGEPGVVKEITFDANARSAKVPNSLLNSSRNGLPSDPSAF